MAWLSAFGVGVAALAVSFYATSATAMPQDYPRQCFDVLVLAKVVGQVPSEMPTVDDGDIIMSWPYFIDLKIKRVIEGKIQKKRITALSVQHTYWRSDLGAQKWWLRRNNLGGYNILRIESGARPSECRADSVPAPAYLMPGPGQTLEGMRKAGALKYRSRP